MRLKYKVIILSLGALLAGLALWGLLSSVHKALLTREVRREAAKAQKAPEVKITLIEGLTNAETYTSLAKQGLGSAEGYLAAEKSLDRTTFAFLDDAPKGYTLQGFLFPDTYRFSENSKPEDVLRKLLEAFSSKFASATKDVQTTAGYVIPPGYEELTLKNRIGKGLTAYEIVTLASIIEKETGRAGEPITSERLQTERRTVAGIFLNRLLIGQLLQSDATVNYVTKSGRASATEVDLKIDSPYNTYKYAGLPPGPIANISYTSLYAALHPIKTDFYYFLHSQTTGEIYYAKTFEDQLKNKAKYLK